MSSPATHASSSIASGLSRRSALKGLGAGLVGLPAFSGAAAAHAGRTGRGRGLVAHYALNGIQPDGTVHDSSQYRNDGAVEGAVSMVHRGAVGNAFAFDGGHVAIPDDPSFGVEHVTVAAWVNPDSAKSREYLFDGRGHRYGLKEDDGTEVPRFFVFYDGGKIQQLNASQALPSGIWTHLAATYDGDVMKLYVNGTLDTQTSGASGPIDDAAGQCRIGDYVGGGYSFDGRLDEVYVFDRALSAVDVAALARAGGS